jgi:hypothetical protein
MADDGTEPDEFLYKVLVVGEVRFAPVRCHSPPPTCKRWRRVAQNNSRGGKRGCRGTPGALSGAIIVHELEAYKLSTNVILHRSFRLF